MSDGSDDPFGWVEKDPVFDLIPEKGLMREYISAAARLEPNSLPIYHLGAAIPIFMTEANRYGLHLKIQRRANRPPAPLVQFSNLLGRSGTGKTQAIELGRNFYTSQCQSIYGPGWIDPFIKLSGSDQGLLRKITTMRDARPQEPLAFILWHDELSQPLESQHLRPETLQQFHDSSPHERAHRRRGGRGLHTCARRRLRLLWAVRHDPGPDGRPDNAHGLWRLPGTPNHLHRRRAAQYLTPCSQATTAGPCTLWTPSGTSCIGCKLSRPRTRRLSRLRLLHTPCWSRS